jgi:hypothetical protein
MPTFWIPDLVTLAFQSGYTPNVKKGEGLYKALQFFMEGSKKE